MGKYLAFCTLALLYVSALADDVVVLTEDNFEKEVGQAKGSLVEFSTPWCGHCKKLAPEYEKLGSSFKEAKSVLIGKVDCDEHKSLCSKYGVSEYPTIQWFPKGSLEPKKYEGPRNAESLAEFVNAEGGIKVHGDPYSPSTMRVVAALYEKELEFEFVPVDLGTGEHKKEHFLLLNPFGQVPAFEDGDLKLFESRAITQHIAHEYADKGTQLLCPGSKKDAAALLVGIQVESHQYDVEASKLVREQLVKPLMGGKTDPAVVEEHEAKLAKVLDVYEARLTQFKYLASDSFTLVDLHHLPTVQYLSWTPTKKLFDSRPHVSAWVSDITSRPAWAKVLALQKK